MNDSMDKLNDLINYIENNLASEISNEEMAKILCVNNYTLQRIFKFITGITINEYIRYRRLSVSAIELLNLHSKIIDLSVKYGYSSPDGFSRAFTKFHGVSPNMVSKKTNYLKNYPPFTFSEISLNTELSYKIKHHDEFKLNGIGFETNLDNIQNLAPLYWKKILNDNKYKNILRDNICFGVINYDSFFPNPIKAKYYIASELELQNSERICIPSSEWAVFNVEKISGESFYNLSHYVYANWIPYSGYNIRNLPELEVYYSDHTEWWLPIEK